MSPNEMVVEVRLFAILRERAGASEVRLTLPVGATVADALHGLSELEALEGVLERLPVCMAVNRDYATVETVLRAEDELALIPPVSGGAPDASFLSGAAAGVPPLSGTAPAAGAACLHVRVTDEPLELERLSRSVADPRAGAIVIFEGVTREVERLDYEAYAEMARERIEEIMRECIAAHGLCAAAVEHRVGSVALGEPSVIVAVSAPHRSEAFEGAREAIDRLKAQAPIWKREHAAGDAGRWAPGVEPAR